MGSKCHLRGRKMINGIRKKHCCVYIVQNILSSFAFLVIFWIVFSPIGYKKTFKGTTWEATQPITEGHVPKKVWEPQLKMGSCIPKQPRRGGSTAWFGTASSWPRNKPLTIRAESTSGITAHWGDTHLQPQPGWARWFCLPLVPRTWTAQIWRPGAPERRPFDWGRMLRSLWGDILSWKMEEGGLT